MCNFIGLEDFPWDRLAELKRNAPWLFLVSLSARCPPVRVSPLTGVSASVDAHWLESVHRWWVTLSGHRRSHRCPPSTVLRSPIGVPPSSAVAHHCRVVTSIRRNIHIFGGHCFTLPQCPQCPAHLVSISSRVLQCCTRVEMLVQLAAQRYWCLCCLCWCSIAARRCNKRKSFHQVQMAHIRKYQV